MVLSSKSLRAASLAAAISAAAAVSAQAQLTASFYGLVADGGDGIGLFLSSGIGSPVNLTSLTQGDVNTDWAPISNTGGSWGARIVGCINVKTTGNYNFNVDSAESAYLYIDGVLRVENGIDEAGDFTFFPNSNNAFVNLTAGQHTIRLDYLNVIGDDDSGYNYFDVQLPAGVSLAEECVVQGVPEVGTMAATGLGAGLVVLTSLRRRKV